NLQRYKGQSMLFKVQTQNKINFLNQLNRIPHQFPPRSRQLWPAKHQVLDLSPLELVTDGSTYVEPSCRLAPALAAAARCCSCWKSRLTDQSTSAIRRVAGRAARSGAMHSAASAITFSTAATTALLRRIRGSIATTVSPSLHFRSACACENDLELLTFLLTIREWGAQVEVIENPSFFVVLTIAVKINTLPSSKNIPEKSTAEVQK
ncbi:hypothetical protein EJB05_18415, partial [Eragrostis curvula]